LACSYGVVSIQVVSERLNSCCTHLQLALLNSVPALACAVFLLIDNSDVKNPIAQIVPDALLMSYNFVGSVSSQYKQIGNAILVNLAHVPGKKIIKLQAS